MRRAANHPMHLVARSETVEAEMKKLVTVLVLLAVAVSVAPKSAQANWGPWAGAKLRSLFDGPDRQIVWRRAAPFSLPRGPAKAPVAPRGKNTTGAEAKKKQS